MNILDQFKLQLGWKKTRVLLEAVAASKVVQERGAEVDRCLAEYRSFLACNELECAMNMLDQAGDIAGADPDYWERLAMAASSMALTKDADEFRHRASTTGS